MSRHGQITLQPEACFLMAGLLLLLPLPWLLAWFLAAALHESGHLAAIFLLGGQVRSLRIGAGGAVLETSGLSHLREALCALAGPGVGLLPIFAAQTVPRLAVCAAVQSAYNLIPVFPLDGGRAARCLLARFLPPEWAARCSRFLSGLTVAFLFGTSVYGTLRLRLGIAPLLLPAGLALRTLTENRTLWK